MPMTASNRTVCKRALKENDYEKDHSKHSRLYAWTSDVRSAFADDYVAGIRNAGIGTYRRIACVPDRTIGALRASLTGLLMLGGLTLSVWTIVYMKLRGKGNPMDAFGHEVAPRTQHLMMEGPYRINRNPMLTGTLIYLASFIVWLWTWQALLVWFIFLAIMFVQVLTEEKRLQGGSYHFDYDTKTIS